LSIVISGCLRGSVGTEPITKRAIVGRLGVRHEVSVHAPPQPPISAQLLKTMPTGPKRTQRMTTIPATKRRLGRPIALPLSEDGSEGSNVPSIITQMC
jgi:hypothetical protein